MRAAAGPASGRVWLFDLDDTLHDAGRASMPGINEAMTVYIEQRLGLDRAGAVALRRHYWQRYGATLIGLVRHHGVDAAEFLAQAHRLPGLEGRVRGHAADLAALARLPGRRYLLTNAPAAYTARVLGVLGLRRVFDGVISIEQMRMFGQLRPKPDVRMFRAVLAKLRVPAHRCVLVEDTLAHQKAAFGLGIETVWMQRWLKAHAGFQGTEMARLLGRKPAYVCARIRSLQQLNGVL